MTEPTVAHIATALGGHIFLDTPRSTERQIGLTRPDGRFVYLEETAGVTYADEGESWGSLHQFDESYRPKMGGHEWPAWGTSEAWAAGLATLLCGQAYRQGDSWAVRFERADGRFVVLGERWAEIYRDRAAYDEMGEAERVEW